MREGEGEKIKNLLPINRARVEIKFQFHNHVDDDSKVFFITLNWLHNFSFTTS